MTENTSPKKRGCFFYGCLGSLILCMLFALGVMAIFMSAKAALEPREIEQVQLTSEEQAQLHNRFKASQPGSTLTVSERELNALVQKNFNANTIQVSLKEDSILVDFNYKIPKELEDEPIIGLFAGDTVPFQLEASFDIVKGQFVYDIRKIMIGDSIDLTDNELIREFQNIDILKKYARKDKEKSEILSKAKEILVDSELLKIKF